jgi:hypothetical protein
MGGRLGAGDRELRTVSPCFGMPRGSTALFRWICGDGDAAQDLSQYFSSRSCCGYQVVTFSTRHRRYVASIGASEH